MSKVVGTTTRVAIVGTGGFGTGRARAYQNTPGFEVACGCRRSAAGREAFGNEFGVPTYEDWRQVVALPDIDAVNVATPTATHAEILLAALQAGKHVLAEAPPVGSPDEMERIISVARERGLVFHVGSNYRFGAEPQALAQAVPALGQVVTAEGMSMWGAGKQRWYLDESLSAGLFVNVHYYHIDLFLRLLGDIESLQAAYGEPPIEPRMGIGAIILAFDTGAIATIHGGIGPGAHATRLVGTEGSFEPSPEGFVLCSDGKTTVLPVEEVDTLQRDCQLFRDEMAEKVDWLPEAEHNRKAVTVARLAWQSARKGRRLNVCPRD